MIFIGLDPGQKGGFAVLDDYQEVMPPIVRVQKLEGLTDRDIWDALKEFSLSPGVGLALIEDVHSMPDQGVASSFAFGTGYGFLRGLLAASACPYEFVTPGKWQKPFGLPTTKAAGSKTAKKNAHKAAAERLFPSVKITHAIADALLIAEYARRTWVSRQAA